MTNDIIDETVMTAIKSINEKIQYDNEAQKQTDETGIDLLIELGRQTEKIKKSEEAKKCLKKKAKSILTSLTAEAGKGKRANCNTVFLQLFYVSFAHLNEDIKSNAFAQKKSTYYKAYKYCAQKYGNFDYLKDNLKKDKLTSVRRLADSFLKSLTIIDKNSDAEKYERYTDEDKYFSINSKVFKKISTEKQGFEKEITFDGFVIKLSVSLCQDENATSLAAS